MLFSLQKSCLQINNFQEQFSHKSLHKVTVTKQVGVIDYNVNTAVDKTDMGLKSIKYTRVQKGIKNMAIRNSNYLYKISTGKKLTFVNY
ncbi:hypothetical protein V1477_017735 [Vespula maculifrons]|uniref:Uncharacterized protein n=1 Tax=Vespula maculifrons TaxID=7453 RepID=A0ABD2B0K7_VESMC